MTRTELQTIEATITVDAPARVVWEVVSDLKRMGEWSPQCVRMVVLGDVRKHARTLNLNREGWKVWPSSATVVRFEPQRAIAFRIPQNGSVWSYELEPLGERTRVTERREGPQGITRFSRTLIDRALGGVPEFNARLEAGMQVTLDAIKAEAERT